MEPVNHWRPVTTEYQQEPPAIALDPSSFGQRAMWAAKESSAAPLPAGITCVAWFYVLAAGVYFVFGSILLADPSSDLAALVVAYFRIVLPLPLGVGDGVPLDNLLAEIFFVLAMVSASIGIMWMARFRPVRWLTLGCASGTRSPTTRRAMRGSYHRPSMPADRLSGSTHRCGRCPQRLRICTW